MKENNLNIIAFIGPDGCGKTTIAEEVSKRVSINVIHKAANFEILPTFSQLIHMIKSPFKSSNAKFERNTDEFKGYHSGMKQVPNSFAKSFVLVSWYTLDYLLGRIYLYNIRNKGEALLFARYYYDYYFQISNKNFPKFLLVFFEIFIPKPQLVFYLHRDSSTIYETKPELSINEIERQQLIIKGLSNTRSNFIEIDASQGIKNTVDQIMLKINEIK